MVRVVGSFNPYIRILGCKGGDKIVQLPDKTDAKVRFRDGTAIRVSFGKGNLGIWEITIMRKGTAFQRLEPCENRSLALFSDVFWIAEDVKDVTFIEKKPPRQYISCCLCKHYIGGGDWGLCCPFIPYPDLIYKDTEANTHCENKFELKDGETIWQPPEVPMPVQKKEPKKQKKPKKSANLYNVKEAAAFLGCCPRTIMSYIKDGKLKFVRSGWRWEITKKNLEDYRNREQKRRSKRR